MAIQYQPYLPMANPVPVIYKPQALPPRTPQRLPLSPQDSLVLQQRWYPLRLQKQNTAPQDWIADPFKVSVLAGIAASPVFLGRLFHGAGCLFMFAVAGVAYFWQQRRNADAFVMLNQAGALRR